MSHEFQSLSLSVLDVERAGTHEKTWSPQAPGIELAPIPGAPAPAASVAGRLAQIRTLMHEFSASTLDKQDRRWALRLLSQPLHRYESTDPAVVDGALMAFVTSAGTDPEALLAIEARKSSATGAPVWQYAITRFTDCELWVRHKGKEVWHGGQVIYNAPEQDPKHRYRVFHDRDIPPVDD
jgi:hypothetical protein